MQEHIPYTGNFRGLNKSEISSLQKQFGKNVFKSDSKDHPIYIFIDILKEPMFLILSGACALYFILGETSEGILMLAAMFFVAAISFYQEVKSSKALAELKQYTEPKINVVRNGQEQTISSDQLVPGDIIILEEGNKVPADASVVQANDLTVNESIITGESIPVEKNALKESRQLFQGTTINSGRCYAEVTAIGNKTVLGTLGKSIASITSSKTLLQKQIGRFVKTMAIVGFIAFATIWLINYMHSQNVVQSLLLGLTLIMSAIPEEIPVAFSSFMALGAARMAKLGIITRQPQTIENLGAVSVICLDKTGTITENSMVVKSIYDFKTDKFEVPETGVLENTGVLRYARLASEFEPFDAMEKAIVQAYHQHFNNAGENDLHMVHEYPLAGQPPMMTHVYRSGNALIIAAKGAPEKRIVRACKLSTPEVTKIDILVRQMASSGYRVLGVCSALNHHGPYPSEQDDFSWNFEGLIALYDPPKKNAKEVIEKWQSAGITIKLLTGDFAQTAINIAMQTGIKNSSESITGADIMQLSDDMLNQKIKNINIYTRMFPDAKLRVIDALKASEEIVAMTGDGVNDGPALKSAHIGIAMGTKGTEIAKEAADLVITDDNLDKITDAIEQGRKIYSNLKKAIRYIISIHVPIICTASLPLILGWKYPNIFTPIHIIFLELIMGPTCSVFFEREPIEGNIMKKRPRMRRQNMFSPMELLSSLTQGLMITAGLLSLYYYFMKNHYPIEYVRTIVFTTLILSNVFLTFVNRSFYETFITTIRYKNALVPYVILLSIVFLSSIYFFKPLQVIFQLTTINVIHYLTCIATSLVCTGWFELYKVIRKNKIRAS